MFASTSALRSLRFLVAVAAIGCSSVALADDENDSGPYVGASYGWFDTKIEDIDGLTEAVGDLSTDDSGAWRAFFGWRFNPYISAEADYVDLGNPRGNFDASGTSGDYSMDLSGFAGYVIGTLPITIFELSAKVGYYWHDVEINVDLDNIGPGNGDVIGTDDSGSAVVYGVGAGVTLFDHLNTKLEYELMDLDQMKDTYVLWLTGAWRF